MIAGNDCLEIARVIVAVAAGKARGDVLHRPLRKNGDAVIALLSVYGAIVAHVFEFEAREGVVDAFDLLHAHDVRRGFGEPFLRSRKTRLDRVDVPGGDFHGCRRRFR